MTISSDPMQYSASPEEASKDNVPRSYRLALVLVTLAVAGLYGADVHGPVRVLLSVIFVSVVPGAAIMSHARPTDPVTVTGMSIALSLSICALLSSIAVWLRIYSPTALLALVALFSMGLLLHRQGAGGLGTLRPRFGRRHRSASPDESSP